MAVAEAAIGELAGRLEELLADLEPGEIPALVGTLERLKVVALARLLEGRPGADADGTPASVTDALLTVEEAAKRLSVSKDWLYRNAGRLPFTVRLGKKHLRFRSVGIDACLRQQGR